MASFAGSRRASGGDESDDPLDVVSPGRTQAQTSAHRPGSSSMSRLPSVLQNPTSPILPVFGDTPVDPVSAAPTTSPLHLTRVISKGRRSISINATVDNPSQVQPQPQLQSTAVAGTSSATSRPSAGRRRSSGGSGSGDSLHEGRRRSLLIPSTSLTDKIPAPVISPPMPVSAAAAAARLASTASPLSSAGLSDEEGEEEVEEDEDEDDNSRMALDDQLQYGEGDEEGQEGGQRDGDEGRMNFRGPNMNVNYKIKFQKARERYKRIQADSALLSKGLEDAQRKQRKLEDELNWLLDTLAARRPDLANLDD